MPTQQGPSDAGSPEGAPEIPTTPRETDPDAIQSLWQASPHAQTYVVDSGGNNSSCTRCHAPVNYVPALEEIPESCFMCKFELTEPPPLTAEDIWANIQCNVCHELDKKGKAKPEYSWLEVAAVGQYAEVDSTTELCLKCHVPVDMPGHKPVIELLNAHMDMVCTNCHDAHSVEATCSTSGCHEGILLAVPAIPGHDAYHQEVTCIACHDAGGLEVGPDDASGDWLAFVTITSVDGGSIRVPYASHNISKESSCTRCHYAGNPWQLIENVSAGP